MFFDIHYAKFLANAALWFQHFSDNNEMGGYDRICCNMCVAT